MMTRGQLAKGGKVGPGGQGMGKGGMKRHRKVAKDSVRGVTKGDIRRLARRGGVKRISAGVYDEVRAAMEDRLRLILKDCVIFLEHAKRKSKLARSVCFEVKKFANLL
ncbi:hypothetical protein MMC31_004937 [Peltigera leucophlebia]|nr:hypothetical protein [Peltigera leucophlebia]